MSTIQEDKAKISISSKRASVSVQGGQSSSEGRDLPLLFDHDYYFDAGHYFDKGRPDSVVSSEKSKISNIFDKSSISRRDDRAKISFRREGT